MFSKKGRLLVAIWLGLSLALVACGDEVAEEAPGSLPTTRLSLTECSKAAAAITAKAGQVAPTVNPADSGIKVDLPAGTRLFISNTFPYAVALPMEWEVKEGQTQNNIKGDLFILRKGTTSGAYVTIISEKLSSGEDSKAFFDAKVKEAVATQKIEYDLQPDRQTGGVSSYGLSYNLGAGQPFAYPVQAMQYLLVAQGRGWSINFTASPNYAAQYCGYFARVLNSFTFTGLVK